MSSLAMPWVMLGESSSDKWPIIDSNKSKAYPGTIPMIKYWGEDEYDLLDLILKLEMKGYGRWCRGGGYSWHSKLCLIIFSPSLLSSTRAVCFISKNMHGVVYVLNWTISPMAWVILRTGSLDWIKRWEKQGRESIEYQENWDFGNWVSSISGVAIDDEWWMIDDGLSVVGLAVMRLWVMAKVKGVWHWWN